MAAAGNDGTAARDYPAVYPGVISVAATDTSDKLTSWSNWGTWVSVAAPGNNILSTVPTDATSGGMGTHYAYASGTSMATPHVSGEVALLLARNASLSASTARALVEQSVDPYGAYSTHALASGVGRINVYRALLGAGAGGSSVPSAPTGLTATGDSARVTLTWTASGGATAYNVYRATTSGAEQLYATGVSGTTYVDAATNGVTFYYQVTGSNSAGESAESNEASATPSAGTPVPSAPTGLAATAGNAQVALRWNASGGATSYYVKRSTVSGGAYSTIASVASAACTDTSVANGTTHYYVVTASN